jgi:hypothetical protein
MSEPSRSELSARMRKVPGQLLLALVNGTAVLVIAAAILAIIASSKVTHVAQNVASTMTDAVLSRVDENPRQLVQNIQRVSDDVHTLTVALTKAKSEGVAGLGPEVAHLNERLGSQSGWTMVQRRCLLLAHRRLFERARLTSAFGGKADASQGFD